ncbi:CLUMA_CG014432, isoform A [Clunio marinus]|uniref:CLUMA_CG014432, isoform A n=1 Tax=Clunio marinus TaxID=568069 RepID=A0A1J1IPE0_9DIPT|nr:CLUMA_CG014432, isoform A [Clunio marinus]
MSPKGRPRVDDLIQSISLHTPNPVFLQGTIFPFIFFYGSWFYFWVYVYGVEDYYEAGLVSLVAIAFIQIFTCLCCFWSVHFRAFTSCRKSKSPSNAVLAKVVPTENNGSSELVKIQKTKVSDKEDIEYYFTFQKIKYIWDDNKKQFRATDFPVDRPLQEYFDSKGHEDENALAIADKRFGKNSMEMVVPEFHELFIERATAPFFVFQVFSVGLWCLDEYWYYSLFTLFMLIIFECTLVQQQLRNMSEIRKMGNKPYSVNVYRNRKWRVIQSNELIPGDLVSITRSHDDILVPCDILMLRGTCIVDESMLTGESVPQMKDSLENVDNLKKELDIEGDGKLFVLFGGTKVVQHTSPTKGAMRAPDSGCIGYVLRTGFNTSQGKLLRTILFGVKRVTENNLETFAFIIFLMVFAVTAAVYVWIKGSENPERNRYKLFLECTLILTSIIPPDLPIELSLAVNSSLLQLSKLFVFCTEPFRIPFAGKVEICCFDKTGTLTSDNLVVEGIAGLDSRKEILPISEITEATAQVLATCHSLAQLDDGLVGDPLEKATLTAIDWNLSRGDSVIPKRGKFKALKIYQRYHFSSSLKRMSVLAGYIQSYTGETHYIGTVKGAPETIMKMLKTVPRGYEETYLEYSRRGARVLALGIKEFGKLEHQAVREMKRDEVENDLTFVGFVIISCPLKPDSKAVVKEILQASHKVVMITGDNPLTACHVAKELRFTKKPILVLTSNDEGTVWEWRGIVGNIVIPIDEKNSQIHKIFREYDFCITGDGLLYLNEVEHEYLNKVLPYVTVFARFAPKQKEFVITTLKRLGYYTLMCGDGTNDVGALKHAHVGVSIVSNAPLRAGEKKEKKKEELTQTAAIRRPTNDAERNLSPRERALRQQRLKLQESQERMQKVLREMDEETMKVVKLGDASIAAPFTSKLSSINCVCQIIKQGRCTLVTTLQMFKILALNALISAYCQSVLYIDGVKFSDTQATLQGLFLAACFLFITRSKPLKVLSKQAPLPNIFNIYSVTTILGQFAVHFISLIYLAHEATLRAGPRDTTIKLNIDMTPEDKEAEFEPNIINSTVYLICMGLQVSTFAVNYKGHPFMESLRENRLLLYSIVASSSVVLCLALNLIPDVQSAFQIIDFPNDFRKILIFVLLADTFLAFAVDKTYLSIKIVDTKMDEFRFHLIDYLVFGSMLVLSTGVGVYFGYFKKTKTKRQTTPPRHQADDEAYDKMTIDFGSKSMLEYLLGSRNLKPFPVSMSLVASYISGVTVLGTPSEIYNYGTQYWLILIPIVLHGFVVSYVYLPVFCALKVGSSYEYLELRFNGHVRTIASIMFVLDELLFLPIIIYVPALAMNQVSGINIHVIGAVVCAVCVFYTLVGGIKAVVHTDAWQIIIMFIGVVVVVIIGTFHLGGPSKVFEKAFEGGRIDFFNFNPSLYERHTFFSVVIGGFFYWTSYNTVNQTMVQRYMSLPNIRKAREAIVIFTVGISLFISVCCYAGLLIYAKYFDCDPLTSEMVSRDDQLFPIYVMNTVGEWKGIAGLFIAGVFGAALSSLSVILNSTAAVLLEDILKGCFRVRPSEKAAAIFVKGSILVLGAAALGFIFVVEKLGGILGVTTALTAIAAGTTFGVFTLGMLNPWANSKGAIFGAIAGAFLSVWVSLGSQIAIAAKHVAPHTLDVSVEACPIGNMTGIVDRNYPDESDVFPLYRLSFHWVNPIGIFSVVIVGTLVSYLTGGRKTDQIDPELISPIIHRFLPDETFTNYGISSKIKRTKLNMEMDASRLYAVDSHSIRK